MKKWKLADDELEIRANVEKVRRTCGRKIYSNCEMIPWLNDGSRMQGKLQYHYDGNNLTILESIDEIYHLYYYWGQLENVEEEFLGARNNKRIVCDIVEIEGRERQGEVVRCLLNCDFVQYKKYYKWKLSKDTKIKCEESKLTYKMAYDSQVKNEFYKIFEMIGDQIPRPTEFEKYCKKANMLLAYDKGEFVGGIIFHINGKVIMEDYIFTTEAARGKGYAGNIQNNFLQYSWEKANASKVYAWIEERNSRSLEVHRKSGFIQTKENKCTFVR